MSNILKNEHIVCIASAMWDQFWVNPQHVMSRLAENNRVLYIESTGLRPPSTSKSDIRKVYLRIRNLMRGARTITDNLFVAAPFTVPLYQYTSITTLNSQILKLQIKWLMHKLELHEPIFWNFYPTAESLVGQLGEKLVIYHCVDEYTEHPSVPKQAIRSMEERLLSKADLVFVTNPVLYKDKSRHNRNVHYLPNVADVEHFQKAQRELTIPIDLRKIPGPRIGYVGNISNYKFNFELVAELAQLKPEWSFVLIGPVGIGDPSTDLSIFDSMPNVHVLGPRPFDEIPAYLRGMDVCLIPFRENKYNSASFPLKFHEYLAAGRKVVTTPLPAFSEYNTLTNIVYFGRNAREFATCIQEALSSELTDTQVKTMNEIAQKNSWTTRMHDISKLVEDTMRAKLKT